MVKRALPLLLLGAACFPPALDETGKRCASDRPCGDGYTCFDFVCQPNGQIDAGPGNWLFNSDFETLVDAGQKKAPLPGGWRVINGDFGTDQVTPHQGKVSARLYSADGGETPVLVPLAAPVLGSLPGQLWCAQAWVRAADLNDAGVTVALFIRERHDDGGTNESTASRPRIYRDWIRIEESFLTEGAERLDVRLAFGRQAVKGESLYFDEVRLKRSPEATCRW